MGRHERPAPPVRFWPGGQQATDVEACLIDRMADTAARAIERLAERAAEAA